MNSKIVEGKLPTSEKYPVLKKTHSPIVGWEYIVLFTKPNKGVVVHVIKKGEGAGDCVIGWDGSNPDGNNGGFGEIYFEPYTGTVQLSN